NTKENLATLVHLQLKEEKERLDEALENVFIEPDRDLPPTGDPNAHVGKRGDDVYAAEVLKGIRLEECEPFSEIQGYEHRIETGDHEPIYCTPYAIPESQVQFVKSELDRMVAEGICRPSTSPWSSPVLVVTKKDEH
ncbi:hypothetical protein FOL47_005533, partial [Perkinsus chesapeaki]